MGHSVISTGFAIVKFAVLKSKHSALASEECPVEQGLLDL